MEEKMFKLARRWIAPILVFIFAATTANGTVDLQTVKQKAKEAVLKSNYYAEYTETTFRFGRRSETQFKKWVVNDVIVKQIVGPSWQWGETMIQTNSDYYYYIPAQNSCLKMAKKVSKSKNRLKEWNSWIKKIDKLDYTAVVFGRPVQIVSGGDTADYFKMVLNGTSFLPVGLEIYRNNLMVKKITYQKVEELPKNFKLEQMMPGSDVKWYTDEELFWQTVSLPRVQNGVNFTIIQPSYLPAGFVFRKAVLEELSSATVVHLVYEGPGKRVLSIFEREKISDTQRLNLDSLKSKERNYGNTLNAYQWFEKQIHLTIIGPISNNEIKNIVHSMK